jgi:hypothetical protein
LEFVLGDVGVPLGSGWDSAVDLGVAVLDYVDPPPAVFEANFQESLQLTPVTLNPALAVMDDELINAGETISGTLALVQLDMAAGGLTTAPACMERVMGELEVAMPSPPVPLAEGAPGPLASGTGAIATGTGPGGGLPMCTMASEAAGQASQSSQHIALGLASVVEAQAEGVGAMHLMNVSGWREFLLQAIQDPTTRFTLFLDNLEGAGAYQQIMRAITRTATGIGGATDWEITQLYQSGRLGGTTLMQDGAVVANPFN